MANTDPSSKKTAFLRSQLETAEVHITGDDRLIVDFKIDELVKKLVPPGAAVSFCGGCNGCMGCSM